MTVDRRSGGLVAVGGTLSCHYNNSCCHRWLRGWRVDDLQFSVTVWVHDISRCICVCVIIFANVFHVNLCVCVIIFANVFHVNLSNKRLLNLNLNLMTFHSMSHNLDGLKTNHSQYTAFYKGFIQQHALECLMVLMDISHEGFKSCWFSNEDVLAISYNVCLFGYIFSSFWNSNALRYYRMPFPYVEYSYTYYTLNLFKLAV